MNNIMRIVTGIFGILIVFGLSKGQGWRGIVPLHSTRGDVERAIGSPLVPNGITYDLKHERVNVGYSGARCEKGQPEWNVPPDTVTSITIYPQTKVMLSDLRADLDKFEKFSKPHNPDSVYYNNDEEGISIGTRSNGEVTVVQYFPSTKDNYLRCASSSTQQLSNDEMEYYKFDEYSNISFNDEKARLDNFAASLHRQLEMKGYIIVHTGRRARAGEAKRRAERAKNYLVAVRGIESQRIVAIDGGHRDKLMVGLYVVPRSVSAPTVSSTVDSSKAKFKAGSARTNEHHSPQPRRHLGGTYPGSRSSAAAPAAYIIAYGGRRSWPGEARDRASCAKDYLVKWESINVES